MKYPLPAPVKSPGAEIYYTQVPEYSKFNIIPVVQPKPTRPKNLVFFEDVDGFGEDSVDGEKKSKFTKYLIIIIGCIAIFAVFAFILRKRRK
jgi:hypothetical protein